MSLNIIYCIDKYYAYDVHIDLLCIYEDLLEEINYYYYYYPIIELGMTPNTIRASHYNLPVKTCHEEGQDN
jgi:hypothetical protein